MKLVYLLKEPISLDPFYVGKGDAKRPYEHWHLIIAGKSTGSRRLTLFLRRMKALGKEPVIEIVNEGLTNEEALQLETDMIKKYGRLDYEEDGILLNHKFSMPDWTDRRHTEESKKKISAARKGWTQSPEHKEKLRRANLGSKHPPRSEQWKEKQRLSHLGRKDSHETFERKRLAHLGDKNPRAKLWKLEREDGFSFEIKALKTWCREQNLSFAALCRTRTTKLFHKGLRVI